MSVFLVFYARCSKLPSFLTTSLDVLIVDDGSSSEHAAQVASEVAQLRPLFAAKSLSLCLHRFEHNQGKGEALRFALLSQRENYDFLGFVDADGSTAFSEWRRLLAILVNDASLDGAIGSRFKALGYQVDRSYRRFLAGRVFASF